jgi:hypothetical protein
MPLAGLAREREPIRGLAAVAGTRGGVVKLYNHSHVDAGVKLPCRSCGDLVSPTISGDCERCQKRPPNAACGGVAVALALTCPSVSGKVMPGGRPQLVAERS